MMKKSRGQYAPDGMYWVCGACGKNGKDRYNLGDTSCFTWATLCYDNTQTAVPEEEWPDEWIVPLGPFRFTHGIVERMKHNIDENRVVVIFMSLFIAFLVLVGLMILL